MLGFTHTEDYQITRSVTQFYDAEGNLVREVVHVRFVGTATNDETGKTLPVWVHGILCSPPTERSPRRVSCVTSR